MRIRNRSALIIIAGFAAFLIGFCLLAFGPRTADSVHTNSTDLIHSVTWMERPHPMANYLMAIGGLVFCGGLVALILTRKGAK